jgi:nucleotide-binding universal stress UspA family protein
MKTLLAIISEPIHSGKFIKYAAQMASDFGMNLHLTYILNTTVYPLDESMTGAANQLWEERLVVDRENAMSELNLRVEELKRQSPELNIYIDYNAEPGSMDTIVNQYVYEGKADMVVLHGYDQNGMWSMGSQNMNLAINVSCPAWIIPVGMEYQQFRRILYATDYNEADITTLRELISLTSPFNPSITALHIADTVDFQEDIVKKGFQELVIRETGYDKISIESLIEHENEDLGETINNFALSKNTDLVVVLKENRNFLENLFKRSSTKNIIKETSLPVLVFQEKRNSEKS